MAKKLLQKLILTASYDKYENIKIEIGFTPKMPDTMEEFNVLPEGKKGLVAIINQFAKQNQLIIKQLQQISIEQQTAVETVPAMIVSER